MTKVGDAVEATLGHDSSFSYYATTTTQSTNVTSAASDVTELPHDLRLSDIKTFESDWSKHNAAATSCSSDDVTVL